MSTQVQLGAWTFPSGNSVECFLEPDDQRGFRQIVFEWGTPPPLSATDEAHYLAVVLPAAASRIGEYLERRGPTVVVMA